MSLRTIDMLMPRIDRILEGKKPRDELESKEVSYYEAMKRAGYLNKFTPEEIARMEQGLPPN